MLVFSIEILEKAGRFSTVVTLNLLLRISAVPSCAGNFRLLVRNCIVAMASEMANHRIVGEKDDGQLRKIELSSRLHLGEFTHQCTGLVSEKMCCRYFGVAVSGQCRNNRHK